MGYGLLGVHVNVTVNGLPEAVRDWRPPLVVILDHSDVWHAVKADSPDTRFVGRIVQGYEPNFNDPNLAPLAEARSYCDTILPWAERMGATYSYWQGVNEPVIQSREAMQRFADFESERARVMTEHGFRVVVGSFSVGNPARLTLWKDFLPALEAAHEFDGSLALHEYAWPTLDRDWPWYLLRHRKVYDGDPIRGWDGLPSHLRTLPLLITECGLDGLLEMVNPPRGWQALHGNDPDRYLEQLAWYDAALHRDRYVWGAAIYCCGVTDLAWKSYDIWPDVAQRLARVAKPVYRTDVPEPDRPLRRLAPTGPRCRPLIVARLAETKTVTAAFEPVPPLYAPESSPDGHSPPSDAAPGAAAPLGGLEASQETIEAGGDAPAPVTESPEEELRPETVLAEPPDELATLEQVAARLDRIIRLLQG